MFPRMFPSPAALALGLALLAGPAEAQIATTVGQNPQVIEGNAGGGHSHGYTATAPDPASLDGAFELLDQSGQTVTDASFRGEWMLVYFGYPGCKETCPAALQTMAAALDILGEDARTIHPLFVDFSAVYSRMHIHHASHSPEPDPHAIVAEIHPRLRLLTGPRRNIFRMLRGYRVRQEHSPLGYGKKEAGLRIDHTTRIYLVGPDGKVAAYYYHTITPAELANELLLKTKQ